MGCLYRHQLLTTYNYLVKMYISCGSGSCGSGSCGSGPRGSGPRSQSSSGIQTDDMNINVKNY